MVTLSKRNFTRGIFSPVVQSRRDVEAWSAGAKRLTNVFLLKQGGVRKRPGTLFVYKLPDDDNDVRLLPFTYSPGQSYVLAMGQASMKPFALGGAVLTETVFAWPGIGRLMFESLAARDYNTILGVFLVSAAMVILFNIVTDIVYRIVDPRIGARA